MPHEPEDQDPVHHEEAQEQKAAASQAFRVFALVVIKGEQMADHAGQTILLEEIVAHISIVMVNPVSSLLYILLARLRSRKGNFQSVIDPSHSVLLETTQDG